MEKKTHVEPADSEWQEIKLGSRRTRSSSTPTGRPKRGRSEAWRRVKHLGGRGGAGPVGTAAGKRQDDREARDPPILALSGDGEARIEADGCGALVPIHGGVGASEAISVDLAARNRSQRGDGDFSQWDRKSVV